MYLKWRANYRTSCRADSLRRRLFEAIIQHPEGHDPPPPPPPPMHSYSLAMQSMANIMQATVCMCVCVSLATESSMEIDVWYRGCQLTQLSDGACSDDVNDNLRDVEVKIVILIFNIRAM